MEIVWQCRKGNFNFVSLVAKDIKFSSWKFICIDSITRSSIFIGPVTTTWKWCGTKLLWFVFTYCLKISWWDKLSTNRHIALKQEMVLQARQTMMSSVSWHTLHLLLCCWPPPSPCIALKQEMVLQARQTMMSSVSWHTLHLLLCCWPPPSPQIRRAANNITWIQKVMKGNKWFHSFLFRLLIKLGFAKYLEFLLGFAKLGNNSKTQKSSLWN